MKETTSTCSLDAPGQQKRFAEFAELASSALLDAAPTPHGARLRLRHSDAVEARLWELIEAERECCSFLEFGVEVSDSELVLEVTGPPSARRLIDLLFDLQPAEAQAAAEPVR